MVHGAWVGEWSWLPILPQLRATARGVYPVSLRGHGTRRSESSPEITLDDHADDVVSVLDTLDLRDVTLVGHSYGGRVITRAFPRLADRVRHMVYLDAHAPVAPDVGQTPERIALAEQHGGMLPFAERYRPTPELVGGEAGVQWFNDRLVQQSFATITAEWLHDLPNELPKTYIYAAGDPQSRLRGYAEAAKTSPGWQYHEITGDHFLMMSHPDETAQIIIDA